MATGAIQEKQFKSEFPDILAGLFGSTTRNDVTTNTSVNSTANTAPLQAAIAQSSQQMTQQQMQDLIASVFSSAATQVPQLTAALANATGSRSSNNSPLALALNEQNNLAGKQLTESLLNYNQRQNQTAVQGAGALAAATRGETRSETRSDTKATGAAAGDNTQLKTLLLGFLANQADKRGLIDKMGKGLFGEATNAGVGATDFSAMPNIPQSQMLGNSPMFAEPAQTQFSAVPDLFQPALDPAELTNVPAGDLFNPGQLDLGTPDVSLPDSTEMLDFGVPDISVPDLPVEDLWTDLGFADGGSPQPTFKSVARPSFAPAINNVVFGYADGGQPGFDVGWQSGVNPMSNQPVGPPLMFQPQQIGSVPTFADGGVTRNRNNMGAAPQRQGTLAVTSGQSQQGQSAARQPAPQLTFPAQIRPRQAAPQQATPESVDAGTGAAMSFTPAQEATIANNIASGKNAQVGQMVAQMALGMITKGLVPAMMNPAKSLVINKALAAASSSTPDGLPTEGSIAVQGPNGAMTSQMPSMDVLGNMTPANQSMISLPTAIDGFATSSPGNSSVGSDASTATDGASADGSAYADGGMVTGPGTGTSDSIMRKSKIPGSTPYAISAEEYIIPNDTLRTLGKDFFDQLVASTHRPVRR